MKYYIFHLVYFEWLNMENLEMKLIEFQINVIWKHILVKLNSKLEK